jgi:flagellar biosynthesis protein
MPLPKERHSAAPNSPAGHPAGDTDRTIAVALDYDAGNMSAPRVVASGMGSLADAILSSAFENEVRVRSDPDLAAILASVDVGEEIPLEAFAAVAEILAYLYQASPEHRNDPLAKDPPSPPMGTGH